MRVGDEAEVFEIAVDENAPRAGSMRRSRCSNATGFDPFPYLSRPAQS